MVAIILLLLLFGGAGRDQSAPSQDGAFEQERQKANDLFVAGKALKALPLYEHLETLDKGRAVFAERRAVGLIAKSATISDRKQSSAMQHLAHAELLRAQGLGDNSALLTNLLEGLEKEFAAELKGAAPPLSGKDAKLAQLMAAGESAFARNDYSTALKAYSEAAEQNPQFYRAALYAGDSCFRLHNGQAAGEWFGKAIAIDPDIETAYRYWGDSLMAEGQNDAARDKFIEAIVAQPYGRSSWSGLQQWAQRARNSFSPPIIQRPVVSSDPKEIKISPETASENGSGRSAWVTYLVGPTTYRNSLFQQKFPLEKAYRHTLAEEVDCLQHVVATVKEKNIAPEKLDPSLRTLLSLDENRILEPWILLHGADRGIAQNYASYRAAHRDVLHRFIAKYDIADLPSQ